MFHRLVMILLFYGLLPTHLAADEATIRVSLQTLKSVQGAIGSGEARAARQQLVAAGRYNLLPVLHGFQGATPLGSNWLRSVFETIAAAEVKAGRSLPADQLLPFVRDTDNAPQARRLAYEWLLKQDASLSEKLLPDMLQDPQPDFRRDAVARLLDQAAAAGGDQTVEPYREALRGAVHEDQVKTISAALAAAGESVNLQQHFGFLVQWKIVGPFDNRGQKGFPVAYPPETELDLEASYDGQLGQVRWQRIFSEDDFGVIDIAKQIENYKGSVMYTTSTFHSADEQNVEFRLGTPNAWKLWLNDVLVFEREEYHRGSRMDQYRIPVTLRAGENTIVLKVCQNEQEQDWAQDYKFQLRVSDSVGAAVYPAGESCD